MPADVGGVPVGHCSRDDVRDLVQTARTNAKATARPWLDQLKDYQSIIQGPHDRKGVAPKRA